jgi:hypothetical protein
MEMMTINDFAPNQGKVYYVPLMDGSTLELCLTAVEALPHREKPEHWPQSLPFCDAPFSLTFLGPGQGFVWLMVTCRCRTIAAECCKSAFPRLQGTIMAFITRLFSIDGSVCRLAYWLIH